MIVKGSLKGRESLSKTEIAICAINRPLIAFSLRRTHFPGRSRDFLPDELCGPQSAPGSATQRRGAGFVHQS